MSAIIQYNGNLKDDKERKEVASEISRRGYEIVLATKTYLAVKTTESKDVRQVENDFRNMENIRVVVACRELDEAESLLLRSLQ